MQINTDCEGLVELFKMMRLGTPTVEQYGELTRLVIALEINGHVEIRRLLDEIRRGGGDTAGPEHHRRCRMIDRGIVAHQRMGELRRAIDVASLAVVSPLTVV